MPTYDYKCVKCGTFELLQRMSEKALTRCPKCKGKVERLIGGGSGLIFKGTGFYITDYKKKTGVPAESKPAAAKTESTKTETPKTPPASAKDGSASGGKGRSASGGKKSSE